MEDLLHYEGGETHEIAQRLLSHGTLHGIAMTGELKTQ